MEDQEIFAKLERILREALELPEEMKINLETDIRRELAADSLDLYEIIYGAETEFGVSISENDKRLGDINTVQEAMDYLKTNYKI
jgi:acyl carrier protein